MVEKIPLVGLWRLLTGQALNISLKPIQISRVDASRTGFRTISDDFLAKSNSALEHFRIHQLSLG